MTHVHVYELVPVCIKGIREGARSREGGKEREGGRGRESE